MVTREDITVPVGERALHATLAIPEHATGLVVFALPSGGGRQRPRTRHCAELLHAGGFATLLVDLLTPEEDHDDQADAALRFDIDLLASRLLVTIDAIAWTGRVRGLPIGLLGGSTGAAAALRVASRRPRQISAVVSCGGRPDLAGGALDDVRAPTLLMVGSGDTWVLRLNRVASKRMIAQHRLEIIPGATHTFEEPGALEELAALAAGWFRRHLRTGHALVAAR